MLLPAPDSFRAKKGSQHLICFRTDGETEGTKTLPEETASRAARCLAAICRPQPQPAGRTCCALREIS